LEEEKTPSKISKRDDRLRRLEKKAISPLNLKSSKQLTDSNFENSEDEEDEDDSANVTDSIVNDLSEIFFYMCLYFL
jgi:hypothetical protein